MRAGREDGKGVQSKLTTNVVSLFASIRVHSWLVFRRLWVQAMPRCLLRFCSPAFVGPVILPQFCS